jgi:signal transduction histidine kinase
MENSLYQLNQLISQSRKIAFAITDMELVIKEVHGRSDVIEAVMKSCKGSSLLDIFPELLGNQGDLEDILAGKLSNLQLVYVNRESQGKTMYLTMDDLPYKDETGRILGIVHVVQDETAKGELEQQITQNRNELRLLNDQVERQKLDLIAANTELVRLSKFKAQFVHVATHELRSPLKLLNTYIKMLLDGQAGPLTDSQSEILKIVQKNGLRVKSMTDELLNAIRLESGQIDLDLKPVDLAGLVNEVVSEYTPQVQSKKQVIDVQFAPELPPSKCDEDWTKQIVINLLNNAGKSTPVGGHISIRIGLAEKAGFVQLSVADTGAGIPEGEQAKVFSGTTQGTSSQSESTQGAGMGLDITRSLVELNGGSIWFESQPNRGSVFHVTLPVASR